MVGSQDMVETGGWGTVTHGPGVRTEQSISGGRGVSHQLRHPVRHAKQQNRSAALRFRGYEVEEKKENRTNGPEPALMIVWIFLCTGRDLGLRA